MPSIELERIFFKDESKHFPQVFCRNRRVIFVKVVVCCAHYINSLFLWYVFSSFEENISKFKRHLRDRGRPRNMVEKLLSEIKFSRRGSVLKGNNKIQKYILPFFTQYQPSVSNLKEVLLPKWYLIRKQPLHRQFFKKPLIISCQKRKILKRSACETKTIKGSIHVFTREGNQCGLSLLAFLISSPPFCIQQESPQ